MKKILLLTFFFLINYFSFAQNEHGLKLGANFASIKTDIDYGSDILPLLCPNISYVYRSLSDKWGYYMEFGYSQSGTKEDINGYQNTIKVHNIDWLPIGIQYAFFSDWDKFRPVLKASIGGRASLYGELETPNGTDDNFLDKNFDILWSAGAGIIMGKHLMADVNYGGGFLKAISSEVDWKNKQTQIAIIYFF